MNSTKMEGAALPAARGRRARTAAVAAAGIVAAAAAIELAMGRVPWCTCGYLKLWHGVVNSSENSQHLTDWYTFSHIIHGILFYALLRLALPRAPVEARFVLAVLLEATWEVFENTPFVIERYRAVTISLDYYGDSVVNSMSDIASMMIGFWFARRAPVWVAAALAVGLEVMTAIVIRDGLALNIIMLVHPFDVIRKWQAGG